MTARPGPNPGTWIVDAVPMVVCPSCSGAGLENGMDGPVDCGPCSGECERPARAGDEVTIDIPCPDCDGIGKVRALGMDIMCPTCVAHGTVSHTFTLAADPEWWDHDREYNTVAAVVLTERSNDD